MLRPMRAVSCRAGCREEDGSGVSEFGHGECGEGVDGALGDEEGVHGASVCGDPEASTVLSRPRHHSAEWLAARWHDGSEAFCSGWFPLPVGCNEDGVPSGIGMEEAAAVECCDEIVREGPVPGEPLVDCGPCGRGGRRQGQFPAGFRFRLRFRREIPCGLPEAFHRPGEASAFGMDEEIDGAAVAAILPVVVELLTVMLMTDPSRMKRFRSRGRGDSRA